MIYKVIGSDCETKLPVEPYIFGGKHQFQELYLFQTPAGGQQAGVRGREASDKGRERCLCDTLASSRINRKTTLENCLSEFSI